jgi:hypothetical protein
MVESATSVFSNTGAAEISTAPAYVAPQVLDEMPTPRSGYENYTYGHPNPIQSSVHVGSTNFSEQNLDGRSQPYGLHNRIPSRWNRAQLLYSAGRLSLGASCS